MEDRVQGVIGVEAIFGVGEMARRLDLLTK